MGKRRKHHAKRSSPHSQSEKPGLLPAISVWYLQVIFSHRQLPPLSALQKWEFHSTDCMVPAPPWGNPFLSERSLYLQAMGHISFVPLPVTLQLQKKNFVFHLVMVPSARSLPPATVTGSGACVIGAKPPCSCSLPGSSPLAHTNGYAAITGITTGKVIDFGFHDSLNMGGCMAPAACDTIHRNLEDFSRSPEDYDAIITGDLGMVGQHIAF